MNGKELVDLAELIPGNMIDHIWGADDHEIDNADIAQCQEMIDHQYDEPYREAIQLLDPEGVER